MLIPPALHSDMAAGVIAVAPTILLFFVLQKYLVEGVKMSGLKS